MLTFIAHYVSKYFKRKDFFKYQGKGNYIRMISNRLLLKIFFFQRLHIVWFHLYDFFLKCGPFLKSFLNFYNIASVVYVLVFWPWGLWDLSSQKSMLVAQSCLTLCDPMDCSPPGSSVHGILLARILEWLVIPFSRGYSWPRDQTQTPCIWRQSLNH